MNGVSEEQIQSIFGVVARLEKEVNTQQKVIEKTARMLGSELPNITDHLQTLKSVKQVVENMVDAARKTAQLTSEVARTNDQTVKELSDLNSTVVSSNKELSKSIGDKLEQTSNKTAEEVNKLNSNLTSSNKDLSQNLGNKLDQYNAKQADTADKIESTISSNFRNVSESFLASTQGEKYDPFKEHVDSIIRVIGGKIDALSTKKGSAAATKAPSRSGPMTDELLKRQIQILERAKTSSDKKLSAIFDAIATSNQVAAARTKKEKISPPEINLSRRDRKLLSAIDIGPKMDALLHEVKDTKKSDGKSPLMKMVSPLLWLLGGIGALAFGVFKFPSIKKMFDTFTKTGIGGNVMSFFQSLGPKNKSVKEIIRGIPFVGRMVDLWDALSLMHKGDYKNGFKQLAFVVPGAEYLALLLNTSKERLLKGAYDKAGDKSMRIPFIGTSVEQLFTGVFNGISSVFTPVINFFRDGFSALGSIFNVLKKGGDINYADISSSLNEISTKYFPALKPIADMFDSFAKSSFDWTAAKMGIKQEPGKEIKPVNIGDLFRTVFETISSKISKAFESISEIMSALGMVFSGDTGTQQRGLNILDRYMPSLSSGIGSFLNILDSIKEMAGPDGKINMYDMLGGKGISLDGKFSRRERYRAVMSKEGQDALDQYDLLTTEIQNLKNDLERATAPSSMTDVSPMGGGMPNLYSITERASNKKTLEKELNEKIKQKEYERTLQINKTMQHGMPFDYFFPNAKGVNKLDTNWKTHDQSDIQEMSQFPNQVNAATTPVNVQRYPFQKLQPGTDKLQMETRGYRGFLERDRQEASKQNETTEKLYQLIQGPILKILQESALTQKTQTTHLEKAASKEVPQGKNNIVQTTVNNTYPTGGGSSVFSAKQNALLSRGIANAFTFH